MLLLLLYYYYYYQCQYQCHCCCCIIIISISISISISINISIIISISISMSSVSVSSSLSLYYHYHYHIRSLARALVRVSSLDIARAIPLTLQPCSSPRHPYTLNPTPYTLNLAAPHASGVRQHARRWSARRVPKRWLLSGRMRDRVPAAPLPGACASVPPRAGAFACRPMRVRAHTHTHA